MTTAWRKVSAIALAAALAACVALVGCSSSSSSSDTSSSSSSSASESESTAAEEVELQIFAANSLQKALPEVQALYTEQNPEVTFADTQFEASGTLVSKLEGGATADVLICASKSSMDNAEEDGTIDTATRIDMFSNDLVICVQSDADIEISSIEDIATNDAITSISIGDPNVVPAGKYALQALESAGLATYDTADDGTIENIVYADSIASKMNDGADKVGTVASYVAEGTCTVGFVYTSDIYRYDGIEVAYTTPSDSHKSIVYPGAVCTSAENADVAADFIDFCLNDSEAQKIFSEYGFELV